MTQDTRLARVDILIQQDKFAEAEKILASMLAEDAGDIHLLAMLAEVTMHQDQFDKANLFINNAIGIAPDRPYLFYIKARIATQQQKIEEAETAIYQAIGLDAYNADYFALLANIKLVRKEYHEALDIANHALQTDPENLLALNTRSTALNKLDRSSESFATIEGALRNAPNNAYTHSNYGWGLLEQGNHQKALEHFQEALKNDPGYGYAQQGMLEAIKAANPVYRIFLKYAFWMSNLTAKYQWGVIIGFYVGFRILRSLAASSEALQPYLNPLIILLSLIAFSTWVINPISNLFLRFNKYGQLLLDKKERMSSNFVAASAGLFVGGLLLYLGLSDERFLAVAFLGFAMMMPLSVMFGSERKALVIYTAALALVGILAIGQTFSDGELYNWMTVVFIFGFVTFQWVANYLLIRENNF